MDYNIYIHNFQESDPFKPWENGDSENSSDKPFQSSTISAPQINTGENLLQNAGKTIKSFLPVLTIAAAIATTKKAIDTMTAFYSRATGDYQFATKYNNFKTMVSAIKNPIGTTLNYLQRTQEIRLHNEKSEVIRSLFGDSAFNNGSFFGI